MPVFEYETVDRAGTMARGRLHAEDQEELVQNLRDRGQLVVAVRPSGSRIVGQVGIGTALGRSLRNALGGVRLGTLVLFTGQLAAMLEAGLHLVRILTAVARESVDARFAKIIEDVRDAIAAGSSFADALARYPSVFGNLYVSIVRAGEASGTLAVCLNSLMVYLEKTEQLRRKVKGALAYPAVILGAAIVIVGIMVVYIVPIFENVYGRANARLPAATLILITISRGVRSYFLFVLVGTVVAAVILTRLARTERGRDLADAMKLRLPVFGNLIRRSVIARACRTLSLLLQSGVPLMEALEISSRVAGNRVIERALVAAANGVREGGTLADTMRESGVFPALVTQLVASGEESGSLAAMLGKAATYYEQQVDNMVATLSTLIEPIMILIMGAIAGSIIFALYMPIFNLGSAVRGGFR